MVSFWVKTKDDDIINTDASANFFFNFSVLFWQSIYLFIFWLFGGGDSTFFLHFFANIAVIVNYLCNLRIKMFLGFHLIAFL